MYVTHSDEVQIDIISPRQSGTYSTYKYHMVQKVESRQLEKEQASKDVAMHVCMSHTSFMSCLFLLLHCNQHELLGRVQCSVVPPLPSPLHGPCPN